ncbi:MAG: DUF465 domain-containing protein [Hyphomonadaceae bacterium]
MGDDAGDFDDLDKMEARLEQLRERHRELDGEIQSLELAGGEAFRVMTLKREKLRIKDQIAWLQTKMTPDIIA